MGEIEKTNGRYSDSQLRESVAISLKRIADALENYTVIEQKKLDDRNRDFADLITQVKDAFE